MTFEKFKIYEMNCYDCNEKYYYQILETRYGERLAHLKYSRIEKSQVAHPAQIFGDSVDKGTLKPIRHVIERKLFDAYQSLVIIKGENLMNNDGGPIPFSC